jgi:hypothetical protein
MVFHTHKLVVAGLALVAAVPVPVQAQAQEAPFAPVMLPFDGTDALSYAAPSALDIDGAGTIELWVRAGWQANPGYDPAILSYQGATGARIAVLVTGDAQALGVFAGPYYAKVPFAFSDGQLHHVALTLLADETLVMIDGEVRDTLAFGMADLPADTFSIGALGDYSPFIGDIGQIRIWDEPIDPEVLVNFAWRPMAATGPDAHPDIDALVGVSAFGNPETGGFVFVGPSDDADITAADSDAVDDAELDFNAPELADLQQP